MSEVTAQRGSSTLTDLAVPDRIHAHHTECVSNVCRSLRARPSVNLLLANASMLCSDSGLKAFISDLGVPVAVWEGCGCQHTVMNA